MFWNKKKKDESEEDLYDLVEESDDLEEDETLESEDENADADLEAYEEADYSEDLAEDTEEGDENDLGGEESEEALDEQSEEVQDGTEGVTVSARVGSLNSLAEFISLRHPLNLQFMRKDSDEVFELRESHFRLARVFGSVSMYREC